MPVVLTVDQRGSRSGADLVPAALSSLASVTALRAFERTAGDELQGVLDTPAALRQAVELLLRAGCWNIGIGTGEVQLDGASARAGRGPGYLAAREAVTSAKTSPWNLRVCGTAAGGRDLESALWLWAVVLDRRTDRGWEVVDLVDAGATYDAAAARLGISGSAVSQRARAAGLVEGQRARELVEHLAAAVLGEVR